MRLYTLLIFFLLTTCVSAQSKNVVKFNTQYELSFEREAISLNDDAREQLIGLIELYKSDTANSSISICPMLSFLTGNTNIDNRDARYSWDRMLSVLNLILESNIPRNKVNMQTCCLRGVKDHIILSVTNDKELEPPPFLMLNK